MQKQNQQCPEYMTRYTVQEKAQPCASEIHYEQHLDPTVRNKKILSAISLHDYITIQM